MTPTDSDGNPSLWGSLPPDILDMITERVGSLMTPEGAKRYRLKSMDERTSAVGEQAKWFFELDFSMCEH